MGCWGQGQSCHPFWGAEQTVGFTPEAPALEAAHLARKFLGAAYQTPAVDSGRSFMSQAEC